MTYQPNLDQSINQLKLELTEWRGSNRPPTPLPQAIWERATQLAVVLGVSPVSQALRLDYGTLKRRVADRGGSTKSRTIGPVSSPTFIEFLAPASAIERCTIEVESARGNQFRVKLHRVAPGALANLLREVLD